MDDRISELHSDIKEIRAQLIELVKLHAIANQTLIEHERRSTNLEARIKPVEDFYIFISKTAGIVMALVAVMGAAMTIYKALS